jgi:hypothetical protein
MGSLYRNRGGRASTCLEEARAAAKRVNDGRWGDETVCNSPEVDCHAALAMTVKGECNSCVEAARAVAERVNDGHRGDETVCIWPEGDCHVALAMTVKGECNSRVEAPRGLPLCQHFHLT